MCQSTPGGGGGDIYDYHWCDSECLFELVLLMITAALVVYIMIINQDKQNITRI